jgi:hypothetical protein
MRACFIRKREVSYFFFPPFLVAFFFAAIPTGATHDSY